MRSLLTQAGGDRILTQTVEVKGRGTAMFETPCRENWQDVGTKWIQKLRNKK